MSAHAGAMTWREDLTVQPAKRASSFFELLARGPAEMQSTNQCVDFGPAGQLADVIHRVGYSGMSAPCHDD